MDTQHKLPTIYPVACHTDHVGPGSTFVAIKGERQDGLDYCEKALAKGAQVLVVDRSAVISPALTALLEKHGARLERSDNCRRELAVRSAAALGSPAKKLKIIAITGTKGKTTTAFLLHHVLTTSGINAALLSTVHNRIGDTIFTTSLTTQQPDYLQVFFNACVAAGVTHVVMEVAAQALTLHRVHGLYFDGVIFTNFSQEHGEFYPTMDEYFAAKCQIFEHARENAPILINGDDSRLACLSDRFERFSKDMGGALKPCPALIGEFNAYNRAAARTMALRLGLSDPEISRGMATFSGVPGRLESYAVPNGATCIIDYAHTPSSYEQVLGTLRSMTDHLVVIFGAGGGRDKVKRPLMGEIAAKFADSVFLTSDNPRFEDPSAIIDDIVVGIAAKDRHKVTRELDRAVAIRKAYSLSGSGSIIVMLGKGPDEYQEVQGVKTRFSEADIVRRLG